VALGAPLPAPVDSTTPPPYESPGLSKAVNAQGQPLAPPPAPPAAASDLTLPATFTPQGTVYGVPASQASVTLQALKPAFLVIHGADGSIYFARQLNAGEAYRAPNIAGLTVDVSEPDAFQAFSGGQSKGVLPQPLTPIAKLVIPAAAPPAAAPPPAASAPKPAATPPTVAAGTPKPGVGKPAAGKPAVTTTKPATAAAKPATAGAKPPVKAKTTAPGAAKSEAVKPKPKAEPPKADAAQADPPF
jgi:hypothetical protein